MKAGSIEAWLHTYYVQPWPHALVRLFNASCCCINYRGVFGLLRVNPIQRCFTVQARLGELERRAAGEAKKNCAGEKRWPGNTGHESEGEVCCGRAG